MNFPNFLFKSLKNLEFFGVRESPTVTNHCQEIYPGLAVKHNNVIIMSKELVRVSVALKFD